MSPSALHAKPRVVRLALDGRSRKPGIDHLPDMSRVGQIGIALVGREGAQTGEAGRLRPARVGMLQRQQPQRRRQLQQHVGRSFAERHRRGRHAARARSACRPRGRGVRSVVRPPAISRVLLPTPVASDDDTRSRPTAVAPASPYACGYRAHWVARQQERPVLHQAVALLVIALIAAVFGFGGIAAGAAGIAKVLFAVFLILALASFAFSLMRGRS